MEGSANCNICLYSFKYSFVDSADQMKRDQHIGLESFNCQSVTSSDTSETYRGSSGGDVSKRGGSDSSNGVDGGKQ